MNPQYPVYIISKGRWDTRYTVKALDRIGVPYHVVVEPQEYHSYAAVIEPSRILQLPFSNLGLGSIPARNWVWEHAISTGAKRHWIMDDNIFGFCRYDQHMKVRVASGTIFRCMEDFVDRYENVAIAGPQYVMFVKARFNIPAFLWNRRIYSCILIKNDLPYRWRGRYNEDTDLSLRALKDGWCTVLFHAFLADKATSMTLKGGNTDELYAVRKESVEERKSDSRYIMAQSLVEQHPDVTTIYHKFGHWQHLVDYSGFKVGKGKNEPRFRADFIMPEQIVNNYGMKLITVPNVDAVEGESAPMEERDVAPTPVPMADLQRQLLAMTRARRGE